MNIMVHPIAQAQFNASAVGTLIEDKESYLNLLSKEVSTFTFPAEGKKAGQGEVPVPGAKRLVTPGVAKRTLLTKHTSVLRQHNHMGTIEDVLCIDRSKVNVGVVDSVTAIVYTIDAYLNDPEVVKATTSEEREDIKNTGYTHVLVTTIGSKGPDSPPVSPNRFLKNVAGANKAYENVDLDILATAEEYLEVAKDDPSFSPIEKTSAWAFCKWAGNQEIDSEIRDEAQRVLTYWSIWATVG